jgi:hypothetical protein
VGGGRRGSRNSAAAVALARDVAGVSKVAHDAGRGAFGDPTALPISRRRMLGSWEMQSSTAAWLVRSDQVREFPRPSFSDT